MKNWNTQKIWHALENYHLLLIFGSILGLFMANVTPHAYHEILDYSLFGISTHFFINEVLMSLFFAMAGKEVWEAIVLKGGSLRGAKALVPVIATIGGVIGPICVFYAVALMFDVMTFMTIRNGWAIPTATDIAFAYIVGVMIFGKNHGAINFLLALAILDDAIGLIILAIFYPKGSLSLVWLLFSLISVFLVYSYTRSLMGKGMKNCPWLYIAAGIVSWFAFYKAGLHPALSLLMVIPIIPHAESDLGFFSQKENSRIDLLNRMEHSLKIPMLFILGMFGFVNAGVSFGAINAATVAVTAGLLVGKPLGIIALGGVAGLIFGYPKGISLRSLSIIGIIAGIGFTVSLFVSVQAFDPGIWQDGAKMGALFSFFAAIIAWILSRAYPVQRES